MILYNKGEVWFVEFPLEEDNTQTINRPILYWQEANLRLASTARVSKIYLLPADSFIFKIGDLHPEDLRSIETMYQQYSETFKKSK